MKSKLVVLTLANVNASSRISNATVRVAVAGDPVTVATTFKSASGVTVVGVPERTPELFNDNPVPIRAGADKVTGNPDAAVAANLIFDS
jgi:hypothetical protein